MSDDLTGAKSGTTKMLFAFPTESGGWRRQFGTVRFVDGHLHKIAFPGFETRSGEGFGITVAPHVVQNLNTDPAGWSGDVTRVTWENGKMIQSEVIAAGVSLSG